MTTQLTMTQTTSNAEDHADIGTDNNADIDTDNKDAMQTMDNDTDDR